MKHLVTILMAAVALSVSAADKPTGDKFGRPGGKPAEKQPATFDSAPKNTASWIDSITVAPIGAIKTEHLDGPSQWGAGLDLGYNVNPFVSIHVVNLSFEGEGQSTLGRKTGKGFKSIKTGEDSWGGLLVDETDLQVDAKISSLSKEKFSVHLVGGAQTDWNDNDYGVNVGLRLALDFNKHVGVSAGYSIRTWFKGETRVDSLASASLNFRL